MMKLCSSRILEVLDEALQENREVANESLDRRTQRPVTPNEELTLNLQRFQSPKRLIELAIASYFLGAFGYFLRLELEERIQYYPEKAVELRLILSSKVSMLEYLASHHTDRSFFGNLVRNVVKTSSMLRLKSKKPEKEKYKVRRRGYQDHGALRPSDKWKPRFDWSLTELQNELEEEQQRLDDTLNFLRGLFGEL